MVQQVDAAFFKRTRVLFGIGTFRSLCHCLYLRFGGMFSYKTIHFMAKKCVEWCDFLETIPSLDLLQYPPIRGVVYFFPRHFFLTKKIVPIIDHCRSRCIRCDPFQVFCLFIVAQISFSYLDAMSKFRKSLPNEENLTSESENDEDFNVSDCEDRSLSPPRAKRRKRQTKLPSKLSEYETEGSIDNTEEELCKCIIYIHRFCSIDFEIVFHAGRCNVYLTCPNSRSFPSRLVYHRMGR